MITRIYASMIFDVQDSDLTARDFDELVDAINDYLTVSASEIERLYGVKVDVVDVGG